MKRDKKWEGKNSAKERRWNYEQNSAKERHWNYEQNSA
jgi:hypothetical protein